MMGEKLIEYYSYVDEHGDLMAKMEVAQQTQLPSTEASTAPDNTENIEAVRDAIADVLDQEPPRL